jgi:hydroxypyruvate isomerase
MPRFAANLSMLYTEHSFLDRFEAAADDGFKAVEFLSAYEYPVEEIHARLSACDLQLVLLNAPPAGIDTQSFAQAWSRGARGTSCLPGRDAEFREGFACALHYATSLACPRVHVMAGVVPAGVEPAQAQATYIHNLRGAAAQAAKHGVEVLIEPINTRDMPGYFLNRQDQAHAIVHQVNAPNLKVQMDLYHCQIMEGDVTTKLRQYLPIGSVGHLQIAGVPDRHEPDDGELNYRWLFELIDTLGYTGWVGCEYRPRRGVQAGATRQGLGWMGQGRKSCC